MMTRALALDSGPTRPTVHERIEEHQGITGVGVNLNCSWQRVHPIATGVIPGKRMGKVGLVAAGDHHGCSVAGADVGKGQENVDLSAPETTGR